jgi:hypothetical protein
VSVLDGATVAVETKEPTKQFEGVETSATDYQFDPAGLNEGPGSNFIVLDDPEVLLAEEATWLDPDEMVLGVELAGEARAYPLAQMAYHHVVNDVIGGNPYLVTY